MSAPASSSRGKLVDRTSVAGRRPLQRSERSARPGDVQRAVDHGGKNYTKGVWVEDQVTFGRVTFSAGARYDHMTGYSPDMPQYDIISGNR